MTKRSLRIAIDIVILCFTPLLYNSRVLSLAFHEIAGLAVLILVGVHLILNWKWVTGVVTRWLKRCLPFKTRLTYILDMVLLGTFLFSGVSGLFISRVLISGLRSPLLRNAHIFSAALALLLFGLHFGLHVNALAGAFKRLLPFSPRTKKILGLLVTVAIVVLGIASILTSSFLNWLTLPWNGTTGTGRHALVNGNQTTTQERIGQGRRQGQGLRRNADPRRHFQMEENAFSKAMMTFITYFSIVGVLAVATHFLFTRYHSSLKTLRA
ncbi:MAG: DUF4405 domain-containing protein [Candidatus Caldatribacteriaceae bacterium]